MAKTIELCDLT